MATPRKVIITCAVTGAIHTPSMSDHLPITPEQIAQSSIEAAEAGAAIIHLHARDPETGEPTPDPAVFMRFLPTIKQSTDAVLNITTGGGLKMGQVIGQSDKTASQPTTTRYTPKDLMATVLHTLLDPAKVRLMTHLGRVANIVSDGEPIPALV